MWTYVALGFAAVAGGFSSALLGIGGGVIMTPILTLAFARGWVALDPGLSPIKVATVTSLAYIVPVALMGCWRSAEPVQWSAFAIIVPAGLVGAWLGAWTKARISSGQLKILFAILLLFVGVRLALSGWQEIKARPPAPAAQASNQGG